MKLSAVFYLVFIPHSLAIFTSFFEKNRQRGRNLEDATPFETNSNSIQREQEIIVHFAKDTNGKIQGKVIDELKKLPSNFANLREPIILSTDGYSFPKPMMKFHSDQGDVIIHNVTLSQWYNNDHDQKSFSTLVGCDSSTKSKIKIELPFNLQIVAYLSVIQPAIGLTNEGLMTLVIKNGTTILKHITKFHDDKIEESFHTISFTNSKIDVQSSAASQILLHAKLGAFFNEIESSLRQFFGTQLNEELNKRNAQLPTVCSTIISNASVEPQDIQLHPFSLLVHNIFNLYTILNSRTEPCKGIILDVGPIVISGLLHFNSSELSISREFDPNENKYTKRFSSRLKIANLKGKFYCNFNHDNITGNFSTVFSFTIDHILLENNYSLVEFWGAKWNQNLKVDVGKIQIIRNLSKTSNGYEIRFVDHVISKHLKSVVAESLETFLKEKIRDEDFHFLKPFFSDD